MKIGSLITSLLLFKVFQLVHHTNTKKPIAKLLSLIELIGNVAETRSKATLQSVENNFEYTNCDRI